MSCEKVMTGDEALKNILKSFSAYYNIDTGADCAPFSACAEFHSHGEQYFLVKAAKLSDIDSNEYAFIYKACGDEVVSEQKLSTLIDEAWKRGLLNVKPSTSHHSTDVTLLVLGSFDKKCFKSIKKIRRFKSYFFGIKGFSRLRLCGFDYLTQQITCNVFARGMEKLFKAPQVKACENQ